MAKVTKDQNRPANQQAQNAYANVLARLHVVPGQSDMTASNPAPDSSPSTSGSFRIATITR